MSMLLTSTLAPSLRRDTWAGSWAGGKRGLAEMTTRAAGDHRVAAMTPVA
jgi:hypothetical protein